MREALFWERANTADGASVDAAQGRAVRCTLCFHRCLVKEGAAGFCGVRVNREGTLFTLVDEEVASLALDPVEKKPLFHFLPGTATLSLGTLGCNFACKFCQNSRISRMPADTGRFARGTRVTPKALADLAVREGAPSISCTYNEPTVFYELVKGIGESAAEKGLKVILVTNGAMAREPLLCLKGLVHAANVDLKSFNPAFYRDVCAGSLKTVLDNLVLMKEMGLWLEVTTLVIPGLNDSDEELREIAAFIRDNLGASTPWHVSAFFPCYQMQDMPRTPPSTIHRACEIGRAEGLHYVYGGNVANREDEATYCPHCHALCMERSGFRVLTPCTGICPFCGTALAGVWA